MAHFGASAMFILLILSCFSAGLQSKTLSILITDQYQQPLSDAVVELISPHTPPNSEHVIASVAQQGLMFTPFVSAITRGTLVDFPNRDKTRHHVYSFSAAKTFEIELYSGKPEQPVLFDKPGIVVLGCNIHDYMQAYIYVGESALLAITNAQGVAVISPLPEGELSIRIWHPWQHQPFTEQPLQLSSGQRLQYQLTVTDHTKPSPPKRGFGG